MRSVLNRDLQEEAELDVTPFMNLMIVLVPVLLVMMSFSQITVHEIRLPDLNQSSASSNDVPPSLEVKVTRKAIEVYYPSNTLIQTIPSKETKEGLVYDFSTLSLVMQEVKEQLAERKEVLIISDEDIEYQTLIATMDAVKSYKSVVVASVVEIELFPLVSLAGSSVK
ncbi:ExbD/TolR family protein [Marinibactrum halimedae]|uniref:Biopolymer transporter ExbD n=1 Tax=Marinibactrum halimedae TaxID=1444977 RepID=A0AA37T1S2_9GAMM|nr:biopolymer transporter ExbD [Marinibactrum halimedae]MCD9457435.1 biopolymer transporter ExbD [Marinibactrum halimedae]GLS25515.1 hypothetical protein GCM10007877_12290 [Marinibactrum halimedae]